MKIVFNQILTEKTDNKSVIKQYKVKSKKVAKDRSTKWRQKEVIDFNPECFDDYYPDITELYDTCIGSNNSASFA